MKVKGIWVILAGLTVAACGEDTAQKTAVIQPGVAPVQKPVPPAARSQDFAQVMRGAKLYQANCAQCHGREGEGASSWRQRSADGKFPPPPLNGTGHAWHHPRKMLHHVIKNGSPGGQGNMPAWGGKLSDEEIEDIIAWFQSRWSDEVYTAWYGIEQRSHKAAR